MTRVNLSEFNDYFTFGDSWKLMVTVNRVDRQL